MENKCLRGERLGRIVKSRGITASDVFCRQWGKWHHLFYSELFSNVNGAINRDHSILQWTHAKEKVLLVLLLPHLASVTAEMLEPRKCGRGSVQTKRRSTGLKARTVPSAQPQKIISSERDKQRAAPVYKTGRSRRVGSFQIPPMQIRQPSSEGCSAA